MHLSCAQEILPRLRIFARALKSHSASSLDSARWISTRSIGAGQEESLLCPFSLLWALLQKFV